MNDEPPRPALRREAGLLRRREARPRFPWAVALGVVGGAPDERDGFVIRPQDGPVDEALGVDLLVDRLEAAPRAWRTVWLLRDGWPEPYDEDLLWLRCARRATGLLGRPLDGFYVVTPHGWRDPVRGERRSWKRLRTP